MSNAYAKAKSDELEVDNLTIEQIGTANPQFNLALWLNESALKYYVEERRCTDGLPEGYQTRKLNNTWNHKCWSVVLNSKGRIIIDTGLLSTAGHSRVLESAIAKYAEILNLRREVKP